jgi:prepilin-type N-terminal cleavage/methylation domain-containing protein
MNTHQHNKKIVVSKGFTLIEIMVSISIFTIIMVTGVGALLSITRSYQVAKEETATTNAIHFALDSMVRDIRIGSAYYADDNVSLDEFTDSYYYLDDEDTYHLTFRGIEERGVLQYSFNPTPAEGQPYLLRERYHNGELTESSMLSDLQGVQIENALFRVQGSNPNDNVQPSVFIYIRGVDTDSGSDVILQTFVSQRNPD